MIRKKNCTLTLILTRRRAPHKKLGVTENHETMISNLYIGGFSLKKKIQQIKNTQ